MTDEPLTEAIARALCVLDGHAPDEIDGEGNPNWQGWLTGAQAAVATMIAHAGHVGVTEVDHAHAVAYFTIIAPTMPKLGQGIRENGSALSRAFAEHRHAHEAPLLARIADLEACIDVCIPDDCKSAVQEDASNIVKLRARVAEAETTLHDIAWGSTPQHTAVDMACAWFARHKDTHR